MTAKTWLNLYPSDIEKEINVPNKTLPQILKETTAKFPNNKALTFYQHSFTYAQVNHMVENFAFSSQQNGVKKNDRVAIMLPNCPQYVIAYYGALRAGGIITQINPMLVEKELQYILNDSGAETIVIFDQLYPKLKAIQGETNVKNVVVVSFEQGKEAPPNCVDFQAWASQTGEVKEVPFEIEHDVAVLQYTGGTTGRSKGAMLTHKNILANVIQSYEYFKNEIVLGEEVGITVIPLFHVFGMTSGMNLGIYCGSNNVLLPRFDLQEVLETIKRERPTMFPGVPTMYVALTNHPEADKYGLDSIKTCNSGSAPMPVELMNSFENKTGAKILEGYGLSEASPTTHCNPPFAERKPGSVGIGMPSTEYKVVDLGEGKEEVPMGELGELIIKGPQIMKGYWNMAEETAFTLRDGWLFTGDIARMDEDGYVYIVDRKKDMIIASGYNVYPRDVEEVLYEHPAIMEAVVVGVPDPYRGETIKAVVVCKNNQTVSEEEIINYCKDNMAPYKVPKMVEFREELPKTAVGKILRRAIRDEAKTPKV